VIIDKDIANYYTKDFCQRMKMCLYDRLEGGVKKRGRSLQIGSFRRDLFEKFFSDWNGERSVKLLKKGRMTEDHNVFICYSFKQGDKFFEQLPKKVEYVQEFLKQKRVIRERRQTYWTLSFLYNMQTRLVHCVWEQCTLRLIKNKWKRV